MYEYDAGETPLAPGAGEEGARARTRRGAEAIVETLCELGVETFFGVPGGPVILVFDAVLKSGRARLYEPRHETSGAFEAIGFHRAGGGVAAVIVTSGPGATNVVTGVVAAHLERVPMVVICGDVPWATTGERLAQEVGPDGVGIEVMLRGVTRAVVRIGHAASAASQVRAAVRVATAPESPGPVLIVAPIDRISSEAPTIAFHEPLSAPSRGAPPDPALIEDIDARMRRAERPLLVLGDACRPHAAAVAALVDDLGVPFMTTPQAKGVVSEDHPLSLRNGGMSASGWARRYTASAPDVALALGTDLDDTSTAGTPPVGRGGALVHVDTDAAVIGRNFPTAVGAACDLGALAGALAERMRSRGPAPHGAALAARVRAEPPFDRPDFRTDDACPIAPHRIVADLEAAAGPDAVFVTDIGEHMLFALHYLTARGPDRFVVHLGLGSMTSGIASAVGMALADRRRRLVCIAGDGGMAMAGMEILLAVQHRLPIVYAVFNDGRYNMVYHGYRAICGGEAPWSTPPVDFVKWAEAVGAVGRLVTRAGEITASELDRLTRAGLPVVLDVRQDRGVRIRGGGRIEAIQQMSMPRSGRRSR